MSNKQDDAVMDMRKVITAAHDLSTNANSTEYVRGQTELVCALLGLSLDTYRELVTDLLVNGLDRPL